MTSWCPATRGIARVCWHFAAYWNPAAPPDRNWSVSALPASGGTDSMRERRFYSSPGRQKQGPSSLAVLRRCWQFLLMVLS